MGGVLQHERKNGGTARRSKQQSDSKAAPEAGFASPAGPLLRPPARFYYVNGLHIFNTAGLERSQAWQAAHVHVVRCKM